MTKLCVVDHVFQKWLTTAAWPVPRAFWWGVTFLRPIKRGSLFHHTLGIGLGPMAAFIHQWLWNPAVTVQSIDLHWPGSFCFLPLETLTAIVLPGDLATRLGEVQVTQRGSCRSVAQLSHGLGGLCEWTSEDIRPSESWGNCSPQLTQYEAAASWKTLSKNHSSQSTHRAVRLNSQLLFTLLGFEVVYLVGAKVIAVLNCEF